MASETGNIAHPGGQKFFREPNPLKHIQPIDSTIISASSHSWGPQRSTCRNAVCTSRTSCDMMCHPRTWRKKRIHPENVACELRPQTLPKPGWPALFLGVGRREAFAAANVPPKNRGKPSGRSGFSEQSGLPRPALGSSEAPRRSSDPTCGSPSRGYNSKHLQPSGVVAQLVRVLDCRSSGCGFESRRPRFRQ